MPAPERIQESFGCDRIGADITRRSTIAGGAVAAALVIAALIWLPLLLVNVDLLGRGTAGLSDREFASSVNDARTTVLQALAGAVVLITAIAAWRQYVLARDTQLTERYAKAVELLGSDTPETRTGAVFALERLARDSRLDAAIVVDVLAAFVRAHAAAGADLPEWSPANGQYYQELGYLITRSPDVQAAMTVLSRITSTGDLPPTQLALPQVDLRRAYLLDALLAGANFDESHLEIAQLTHADLRGASLMSARLDGALLLGADLSAANLQYASLRGAQVDSATSLARAALHGADLTGVNLEDVTLGEACADEETRWPEGFDAATAGVLFNSADIPQ
jgi:Pentapeptide repeats (8 copies)